jgi:hypothetical protein
MKDKRIPRNAIKHFLTLTSVLALGAGFITSTAQAAEAPLTMGTASTYGVLAFTGVTAANPSGVSGTAGGDIGVGDATPPTGTITRSGSLVLGGTSSTSALPAAAVALADNRGGTSTVVELGAGRTITPGAYTGGTLEVNGTLTLNGGGSETSVFIFRSAATLVTGTGSSVVLTNGAQACNVFWQVGSSATLGASSTIVGHVIASSSISTGASSTVSGQLVAINGAVTLGGTSVVNNSCSAPAAPAATATPVVAPERPAQTSVLDSCNSTTAEISTLGQNFLVDGNFTRPVTQVSVGGEMLPSTAWTASSTEVSIMMPAHVAGMVDVVIYNATVGALTPVCAVNYVVPSATLHIVKAVVNNFAGTSNPFSFTIHVMQNGMEVFGSPATTLGATGRTYTLAPGQYILSEDRVAGYRGVWSGLISTGGMVTLTSGQDLTVTRTNFDLNPTTGSVVYVDTSTATTPITPTETGGVLPNTSTPWGNELLLGGGLMLLGAMGFTSRKFLAK